MTSPVIWTCRVIKLHWWHFSWFCILYHSGNTNGIISFSWAPASYCYSRKSVSLCAIWQYILIKYHRSLKQSQVEIEFVVLICDNRVPVAICQYIYIYILLDTSFIPFYTTGTNTGFWNVLPHVMHIVYTHVMNTFDMKTSWRFLHYWPLDCFVCKPV